MEGVLLYVKDCFKAAKVEIQVPYPEHVWCRIPNVNGNLFIGICYRSPNEDIFGKDNHVHLRKLLSVVSRENCLIMGGFDYRNIEWRNGVCSSNDETSKFLQCVNYCFLAQHVTSPTRGTSLLDLVMTTEPELLDEVIDFGCFSNSDHRMLGWKLNLDYDSNNRGTRVKYNYKRMDKEAILYELSVIDWHSIFEGSVGDCWEAFKQKMLELQRRFVPKTNKNGGRVKKIWMSHRAIKLVKKKHRVYRRYRDDSHPAVVRISKKAKAEIVRSKRKFDQIT